MDTGAPTPQESSLELATVAGLLRSGDFPTGVWHPNGFMIFRLGAVGAGSLRLHCWPAGARVRCPGNWPIHDHMWDFRSQVLVGTVHENLYRADPDPNGAYETYDGQYGDGYASTITARNNPVRLHRLGMRHHAAGEVYDLPARTLHSTHVSRNEHAVTLMLTGAPQMKNPILLGPPNQPPLPYIRPPVSPERHVLVQRLVADIEEIRL